MVPNRAGCCSDARITAASDWASTPASFPAHAAWFAPPAGPDGAERPKERAGRRRYRPAVLEWADSDGGRAAIYLLAAAVAVVAWWREHRKAGANVGLWPTFWLLSAAFLVAMAVARATDLGGLATELGRSQ